MQRKIRSDAGVMGGVKPGGGHLSIRAQLTRATAVRDATLEALDHLGHGVVLVGIDGRARYVNAAADRVFNRRDGLWLSRGAVCCSAGEERRSIQRAMVGATGSGAPNSARARESFLVSRPSGKQPYRVIVAPLGGERIDPEEKECCAALIIEDWDQSIANDEASLRDRFGFTATEAHIASELCRGQSLPEIACALHVSHNTARTHVARILSKSGARRQTDLVRILLTPGPRRHRRASASPDR